MYNIDRAEERRGRYERKRPYININAIVGVNGSGKSTLVELLYWGIYNIGCQLSLLEDKKGKPSRAHDFLDFEILYTSDKRSFYCLKFMGSTVVKFRYSIKGRLIKQFKTGQQIKVISDLKDFFYTVAINYSHYSLNTREVGDWLHPLFHKNDGYQTPIVLNPLRDEGEININKEAYLLRRRLQANILEIVPGGNESRSLRNLGGGKIAKTFSLVFNAPSELELSEPISRDLRNNIILGLERFYDVNVTKKQLDESYFINISIKYIERKLKKIARSYRPYFKYQSENGSLKNVQEFLRELRLTDSHITFKLKGVILYIKYFKEIFGSGNISFKKPLSIDVEKMSRTIREIASKERFLVNTFMMAPPPFFTTEIVPSKGGRMDLLSSGEKQRIHSISSVVYHLINLNSVERQKKRRQSDYVAYNSINLVLDEIELYYHPEWQRRYVADLLDYIGNIGWRNIDQIRSINITFLTHSPYILSDIPINHVLRLEEGRPISNLDREQTFGANIHELLARDFFMRDGFLGEWAKRQIEYVIRVLDRALGTRGTRSKIDPESLTFINKLISVVGEPIVKAKLQDMVATLEGPEQQLEIAKKRIATIAREAGISVTF